MRITITSYDSSWPLLFQQEAEKLRAIFGKLLCDLHHIGSTAIPGISSAKPVIDMLVVADDITQVDGVNEAMKGAGYEPKGEFGIPFRRFFLKKKKGVFTCHLHVYEEGNPEIERHLAFRDYMRGHADAAEAYAKLKRQLVDKFCGYREAYVEGKEGFIRDIDKKAGATGLRLRYVNTPPEWRHYHRICKESIFDGTSITYDPHHPTLRDPQYHRFVLYQSTDIIGMLVMELRGERDAILRLIAIDAPYRNQRVGTTLAVLGERWLMQQGKRRIFLHAHPKALSFYYRLGYLEMPFLGQDISPFQDAIDMGKNLISADT